MLVRKRAVWKILLPAVPRARGCFRWFSCETPASWCFVEVKYTSRTKINQGKTKIEEKLQMHHPTWTKSVVTLLSAATTIAKHKQKEKLNF